MQIKATPKRKLGIIGKGVVGSALGFSFEKLGHEVVYHDLKLGTKLEDLSDCYIVFVCVPTPSREDGSCDTSIVRQVVLDLFEIRIGYTVIKSTVEPGTTHSLIEEISNKKNWYNKITPLGFSCEFLRESSAVYDAVENLKLLPVGTYDPSLFEAVVECHGDYPQNIMMMSPSEAELLKYMHNCFNALRIGFANEFYDLTKKFHADYDLIKKGLLKTSDLPNIYLDCNDNMRGFGGPCLPKDLSAIINLAKKHNVNMRIMEALQDLNKVLKTSVKPGMRV